MDTENLFIHQIQNFPSKYRRTAIVGGIESIKKRDFGTIQKTMNQLLRPSSQTNPFVLPPVNKNLINLASEELKNDDNILAFLAFVSCGFALAENEETFMRVPTNSSYTFYLRCGIMICSIASIFWIVRRYQILLLLKLLNYRIGIYDSLIESELVKPMAFEILVFSLFSPPGIDYFFEIETLGYKISYSIDDIFTFITLLRLYTFIRLFGHHSIYTQTTAETICQRNGESASSTFALKCFIQDSPFIGIGIVFFSIALFTSLALKIAERPSTVYKGIERPSMLGTLADSLWVIFFTTTTVGYGNIYPITHPGRIVCIVACIFGNMYLGMLVVAIHQKMNHSNDENLAYAWICRHYMREDIKKYAARVIQNAVRLYFSSQKWKATTLSKIKPNGSVVIKGKLIKFDMNYLTKEQYIKKSQLYRKMKSNILEMKLIIKHARNAGQKDIESVKLIEDTVGVDTSLIFKKIRNMITRDDLLTNSKIISSQKSIEQNLLKIKANADSLRKSLRKTLPKTIQKNSKTILSTN